MNERTLGPSELFEIPATSFVGCAAMFCITEHAWFELGLRELVVECTRMALVCPAAEQI